MFDGKGEKEGTRTRKRNGKREAQEQEKRKSTSLFGQKEKEKEEKQKKYFSIVVFSQSFFKTTLLGSSPKSFLEILNCFKFLNSSIIFAKYSPQSGFSSYFATLKGKRRRKEREREKTFFLSFIFFQGWVEIGKEYRKKKTKMRKKENVPK